jgi:hypothetical protein
MADVFRLPYEGEGPMELTIEPKQSCRLNCVDITISPKPTAQEDLEIFFCRHEAEPWCAMRVNPADDPQEGDDYTGCLEPSRPMRFRHGDCLWVIYANTNNRSWSVIAEFEDGDL